jgi:hypothetical protein
MVEPHTQGIADDISVSCETCMNRSDLCQVRQIIIFFAVQGSFLIGPESGHSDAVPAHRGMLTAWT